MVAFLFIKYVRILKGERVSQTRTFYIQMTDLSLQKRTGRTEGVQICNFGAYVLYGWPLVSKV